jgi:hypothetical protein
MFHSKIELPTVSRIEHTPNSYYFHEWSKFPYALMNHCMQPVGSLTVSRIENTLKRYYCHEWSNYIRTNKPLHVISRQSKHKTRGEKIWSHLDTTIVAIFSIKKHGRRNERKKLSMYQEWQFSKWKLTSSLQINTGCPCLCPDKVPWNINRKTSCTAPAAKHTRHDMKMHRS